MLQPSVEARGGEMAKGSARKSLGSRWDRQKESAAGSPIWRMFGVILLNPFSIEPCSGELYPLSHVVKFVALVWAKPMLKPTLFIECASGTFADIRKKVVQKRFETR